MPEIERRRFFCAHRNAWWSTSGDSHTLGRTIGASVRECLRRTKYYRRSRTGSRTGEPVARVPSRPARRRPTWSMVVGRSDSGAGMTRPQTMSEHDAGSVIRARPRRGVLLETADVDKVEARARTDAPLARNRLEGLSIPRKVGHSRLASRSLCSVGLLLTRPTESNSRTDWTCNNVVIESGTATGQKRISRRPGRRVSRSRLQHAAARALHAHRLAAGWIPVGRKIGFTNRTIWTRYGVYEPIWGTVYDRTLIDAKDRGACWHRLVRCWW